MKKLNITFCSFPDFSSNAKALYEYMKNRYKDNMNLIWAVNSDDMLNKLKAENVEVYKIGNVDYYEKMKDVDVFFTTHCNLLNEKNEKSIYVELWHGISPKQVGYMSDNMLDFDKEWYESAKERVDYIILPSDFWRVIFATRFNIEYSSTLSLGYPKLNYIINPKAKENLRIVLNEYVSDFNKIIYYMPTFRKGCNRGQEAQVNTNNIFNIQDYNEEELFKFLEENNYLLCIKKHPSEELDLKYAVSKNVRVIEEKALSDNNLTVNDILDAADLMITDYSSLGIEFVFLNKPVVYLTNDIEEYRKNRGFTFGNIDFWMPGYQVKDISQLKDGISDSLSENFKYKEEFKKKRELWFSNLKDGGCDNICDYFFDGNNLNSKLKSKGLGVVGTLKARVDELSRILDEKNEVIAQREARIKELDDFIAQIINSKGWKFLEGIRKLGRPFKK